MSKMTLQDNTLDSGDRRRLTELLGRALLDQELRDRLFADPEAIGRAFELAPAEIQAIKQLDRQKFEAAVTRLRWG